MTTSVWAGNTIVDEEILKSTKGLIKQGVTTEPTFQINSDSNPCEGYKTPEIGNTSTSSTNGISWQNSTNGSGLIHLYSQDVANSNNGDGIVDKIEINFNQGGAAQIWTGDNGTLSIRPGFAEGTTVTFDSNGHGIQMEKDGTGEFKLQFRLIETYSPEHYANFTFSNSTGDDALKGNLKIVEGYHNYASTPTKPNATVTFSGNLAGNLIQENMWDYTPFSEINFTKGSITENVEIQNGGITLKFAEGGVKGNVDIFARDTITTTVKFIRTTGDDLSIGKAGGFIEGKLTATGEGDGRTNFLVGYDDSVKSGNKVISFNPEDSSKFDITRGSFSFYNMKAIKFVDDNGATKTLTLRNGAVENSTFQFDRSVISNDQVKPTIIMGNLVAQDRKSIRLSLIDDDSISNIDQNTLKTLHINGSINVTGGGLSLFYNDRLNCFEAKVEATGGVTQQGGFIGRNDAWFERGSFGKANNTIPTIQATNGGTSHLIFEDDINISGVSDGANTISIKATGSNNTQILFKGNTQINGAIEANNGTNTIQLETSNSSINGKISASGKGGNKITAKGGAFTITGISTKDYNGSAVGNTLNLRNATLTINARSGETADTDINGKAIYAKNGNNSNTITAQTININGDIYVNGGISSSKSYNSITGHTISVTGNISGDSNNQNNFTLSNNASTLTLQGKNLGGTTHAISSLNASGGNNTLTLDNTTGVTSGAMRTTISTLSNGENLTATLKGKNSTNSATLTLNGGTLKSLTLGEGSGGNILDLSNATSLTITNQINVGNNQDLTIKLKNTTLTLNNGIATNGNGSKIELVGDTTNTSNSTLSGGAIHISNIALSATISNTLTISSSSAVIDNLTASGSTSNTLALSGTRVTINSALNTTSNPLSLSLDNSSTLVLSSSDNTITSLSSNGGLVDLSVGVKPQVSYATARSVALASNGASARNTLTISGNFTGTATFRLYASKTEADKVVVNNTSSTGNLVIQVTGDVDEITSITRTDNVMVADVSATNGGNGDGVNVTAGTSIIDGEIIQVNLSEGATAGQWYIGNAISKGVDTSIQEVVSSALAVNYDLYLANFNSLNKRMGELRDNPYNQGVWARVFGGAMSNDFGVGSKTDYVTAQAGYDYSLSLGNARNYMGIAVAYGASSTKSNPSSNVNLGVLDNINSSMIEVGIYNAYVSDSGWYNDTIFKFDYIMSDFTLKAGGVTKDNSTSNFAMILSDEFGYRYSFGVNEKGSWYIDPQVEVAFGYFNQSDFNQALNASTTREMKATQDSILTLRSRAGLSLGKKFNTERGFASLYVGAFYEYDYIEGGNAQSTLVSSNTQVSNPLASLSSNGRAIVNVGSNIELMDGVRMYIDVEKSFGDKQRTDVQFNFGARYSFGERSATLSKQTQQRKEIAPLKVSEENASVQEDSQIKSQEKSGNTQEQKTQE